MGREPQDLYQPNSRRILIAGGLASVAAAIVLAFTGEDDPAPRERTVAIDMIDSAAEEPSTVVRARGRGAIISDVPTPSAPTDPTAVPDTRAPAPDDVREHIADEIGDRTDAPRPDEEDDVVDQVLDLVQGGSSVEDAVEDILGPPENRTFRPLP